MLFYTGPPFPWLWFDPGFCCHNVQHIFHDLMAVCLPPGFFVFFFYRGSLRWSATTSSCHYWDQESLPRIQGPLLVVKVATEIGQWILSDFDTKTWKSNLLLTDVGYFAFVINHIWSRMWKISFSVCEKKTDIQSRLYPVATQAHNHDIENGGHEKWEGSDFSQMGKCHDWVHRSTRARRLCLHALACRLVFGIVPLFPLGTG